MADETTTMKNHPVGETVGTAGGAVAGGEYASWDAAEADLERNWDKTKANSNLGWNDAKHAVRDGWNRVERAIPGDSDGDGR